MVLGDRKLSEENPVFLEEGRDIVNGINTKTAPDLLLTDWTQYYT